MPFDPDIALNSILFVNLVTLVVGMWVYRACFPASKQPVGKLGTYQPDHFDLLGMGAMIAFFTATMLLQQVPLKPGPDGEEISPFSNVTPLVLVVNMFVQMLPVMIIAMMLVVRRVPLAEFFSFPMKKAYQLLYFAPMVVLLTYGLSIFLQLFGYEEWLKHVFGQNVMKLQEGVLFYQETDEVFIRVLFAVSVVVIAPVVEEIVFRGYIYKVIKRYSGRVFAMLVSAVLFAVVHNTIPGFLPLAFLAVLLTISYEMKGSLWAPISIHALFNACTLIVQEIQHHHS